MKIVEDCWNQIETYNCQYGAHVFAGSTAKIYVNSWLAPSAELYKYFYRQNDEGFTGHCLLVFKGVQSFDFSVTLWEKNEEGKIVVNDPVVFHYSGFMYEGLRTYELEGSLHGFPSSVSGKVEAQGFELHILERDEPARET